ncbi:MAG: hypothetical protein KKD28_07020, partial [Chloroflexi bacterium]|nr:hypothetical protein [Chloroflexota bacterium]MBU1661207.1 hypothetical protein [Chloroflexota bacterium]
LGHNGTKIGPKAFTIYRSPFTIYNSPGDLGLRSVTPTTVTFWDCTHVNEDAAAQLLETTEQMVLAGAVVDVRQYVTA